MNSRCARREKRNHPIANGCGPALGQDPSSVKLGAVQCDVPGRGDSERTRAAMPSVVIVDRDNRVDLKSQPWTVDSISIEDLAK